MATLPAGRAQERRVVSLASEQGLLFAISVMGIAALVAAVGHAALAWDGAGYLFETLMFRTPFAPMGRLINVPLELPALLLSRWTDNVDFLGLMFCLPYTFIPVAAIVVSWWVVRTQAPALIVWPVLAIALGTLPGQMFWVSEGMQVVQLAWPLWLMVLLRVPRRCAPVSGILTVALVFSHPTAIVVLVVTAVLSAFMAWQYRPHAHGLWLWSSGWAIAAVARYALSQSSYDQQHMNFAMLFSAFHPALDGWPLLAISGAIFSGLCLLRGHTVSARLLPWCALATIVALGCGLLAWASAPRAWGGAYEFRLWAVPTTLPFLLLAVCDRARSVGSMLTKDRMRVMQAAALVFGAVLVVQTLAFGRLDSALRADMHHITNRCVPEGNLGEATNTAITGAAIAAYSVLLQGTHPRVVVAGETCDSLTRVAAPQLYARPVPWRGWFDLTAWRMHPVPTATR